MLEYWRIGVLEDWSAGVPECWLASGRLPQEVAQSLGVSVPTLYRWVPASSRT